MSPINFALAIDLRSQVAHTSETTVIVSTSYYEVRMNILIRRSSILILVKPKYFVRYAWEDSDGSGTIEKWKSFTMNQTQLT